MSPLVLGYGALASLLAAAGGLVPPPRTRPRPFLLGVAAGFLLGLAIIGLVPEALRDWHGDPHGVLALVVLGYLAVGATHRHHTPVPVERDPDAPEVPGHARTHDGHPPHDHHDHEHGHPHGHDPGNDPGTDPGQPGGTIDRPDAQAAVAALALHAFADGASVAAVLSSHVGVALPLVAAALLHKLPEGAAATEVLLSAEYPMARARRGAWVIAGATMAGAVAIALSRALVPYALPLAAGMALHVAATTITPRIEGLGRFRLAASLAVGAGSFALLTELLERFGVQ